VVEEDVANPTRDHVFLERALPRSLSLSTLSVQLFAYLFAPMFGLIVAGRLVQVRMCQQYLSPTMLMMLCSLVGCTASGTEQVPVQHTSSGERKASGIESCSLPLSSLQEADCVCLFFLQVSQCLCNTTTMNYARSCPTTTMHSKLTLLLRDEPRSHIVVFLTGQGTFNPLLHAAFDTC
jgi:hypothetical protein